MNFIFPKASDYDIMYILLYRDQNTASRSWGWEDVRIKSSDHHPRDLATLDLMSHLATPMWTPWLPKEQLDKRKDWERSDPPTNPITIKM